MFSLCKGIKSANSVNENMKYQLDKMDINYKSYISKINKKRSKDFMMFYSLNNTQEKSNFKEAIFNSLASDGGLYFPRELVN